MQQRLSESTQALRRTSERLASGLRINRPGDDAAGLAISEGLEADTRILNQGVRNVSDGISALSIADAALNGLGDIVARLRELATEAANGTLSNSQRRSLDKEAQALAKEYTRIARTTSFNGVNIFDGTASDTTLQAGYSQLSYNFGGGVGDGTLLPRQSFATGPNPYAVAVGDFNGDGIQDLATADGGATTVSVLLGKGDGTFGARQSFGVGSSPFSVAVGDFNGDGIADLVSSNQDSTLGVLLGNGDGTFTPKQAYATAANPSSVSVGDFNGDGVQDLVSADSGANAVSVLLGKGDGTFLPRQAFGTGANPVSVSVGDFNGDGIQDLASSDGGAGSVSVLLGKGDGTFGAKQSYVVGTSPRSVAVGDFNGDGVTDLVSADLSSDSVSVLLGKGDGTFLPRRAFATGVRPVSVAVGDFNGDGVQDLVAADNTSDSVSVLLGNSDGTFGAEQSFGTGANPYAVAVGDFNGDGVQDIAAADNTSSTVSVLIGGSLHGVSALQPFSVATRDGSKYAMSYFAQVQTRLLAQRGKVGAFESRVRYAVNTLSASSEEFAAARSRITDADLAEESANLAKARILQHIATAVLSQANLGPALALVLLKAA